MKRAILIALVLGVATAAAHAAITTRIAYLGSHTLKGDITVTINVYQITLDAGPGRVLGSVIMDIGSAADPNDPNDPTTYDDPFQAWYRYWYDPPGPPPADWVVITTPTADDVSGWGSPYEDLDTHFLPSGIAGWTPVVTPPTETNDGSIQSPVGDGALYGVGNLKVETAVPSTPVDLRTRVLDIARVGVVAGTTVYFNNASADDLGNVTHQRALAPEPATLSLLALGAVALLRRRR